MKNSMGKFVKGMGIGAAIGCTAGAVGAYYVQKNKKGIKRNAGRALHSFGDLLDNVTDMF